MKKFKQLSFSRLFGEIYNSDAEAKAARDAVYLNYKSYGAECKRWVCKNQLKKYAGLGIPDGRSCDVYMLNIWIEERVEA
jgi:hypothetical protein